MKERISILILSAVVLAGLALSYPVSAQLWVFCGQQGGTGAPCVSSYAAIISNLEIAIWVIFAAIVLVSFVIAGIMFVTAQGNPEKLKAARSAVIWGVAGIIVGVLAYSIVSIVANVFLTGA